MRAAGSSNIAVRPRLRDEDGFTLIELIVALTIIAGTLVSLAYVMYGGLQAFAAAKQRSSMLEIANAEVESLRALPYTTVGVDNVTPDPDFSAAYPGGTHDGRNFVPGPTTAPPAVSVVTVAPVDGAPVPYTVRRWVTWDDPNGGTLEAVKRLEVVVEYLENSKNLRRIPLASVLYPGGLGAGGSSNQPPLAVMNVLPEPPITAGITSVNFDSTGSSDPDGVLVVIKWEFGDGATAAGATASYTYPLAGSYTARMTIIDDAGAATTVSKTVNVASPVNNPPVASLDTTVSELSVNVAACPTTPGCDPDGDTGLQYRWNWGDGITSDFVVGVKSDGHTYSKAGTFTITLTVKDAAGATSDATKDVTVSGCGVVSGEFSNPVSNPIVNDILATSNGTPLNEQFKFVAETSDACSALTVTLPAANNKSITFMLSSGAGGSGLKTWSVTEKVPNGTKFTINATGQTGFFSATSSLTGDTIKRSFTFYVHE